MIYDGSRAKATELLSALLARSVVRQRIVQHLVAGRSRKTIAALMRKSPHTIDGHIKAIYRATGCGDRAMLILLASHLFDAEPTPAPGNGGCRGRTARRMMSGIGVHFDLTPSSTAN